MYLFINKIRVCSFAKSTLSFVLLLVSFTGVVNAQNIYDEQESIVVVEIESRSINSSWTQGTSVLDGDTLTYFTAKANSLSNPAVGTLNYRIQINNPGTYRFQWHSKVGVGTSATDSNDDWLKILADDFYAKKNADKPQASAAGHIVHPNPTSSNKKEEEGYPNGNSKNGWFKVYSTGSAGTQPWKWKTFTSDSDPHAIYADFDSIGIYTVQISGRSAGHFLDRFVMYDESLYTESSATSLTREANPLVDNEPAALLDQDKSAIKIYPNPVTSFLNISSDKKIESYDIYSLSGKVVLSGVVCDAVNTIDVMPLDAGLCFLDCSFKDGQRQLIRFVKSE